MGGQLLTRRTRRFAGCFALLRGRFARFAQGITHISQTFRNVSRTFRGRFTGYAGLQLTRVNGMFRNVSRALRGITRGFTQGVTHVSHTLRARYAGITHRESVSVTGRR